MERKLNSYITSIGEIFTCGKCHWHSMKLLTSHRRIINRLQITHQHKMRILKAVEKRCTVGSERKFEKEIMRT